MVRYSVFGHPVSVGSEVDLEEYPRYYQLDYDINYGGVGSRPCIILCPKGPAKPAQIIKVCRSLENRHGLPCLVMSERLTPRARRELSASDVSWFVSDALFCIPFFSAMCAQAKHELRKGDQLSWGAQRLALHIVDGSWEGLTATQVSRQMRMSLASTSNYFGEIEAIAPDIIGRRGRASFIDVQGLSSRELFVRLRPHMGSPVKKRSYYLRRRRLVGAPLQPDLPLSGVSALSEMTMLADNSWKTYAMYGSARDVRSFADANGLIEVAREDSPSLAIEQWRYPTDASNGMVHPIALILDVEDILERIADERLEGALEKYRSEALDGSARN